jgi:tetrahydromethanopterin S-methyltransferase subunit F
LIIGLLLLGGGIGVTVLIYYLYHKLCHFQYQSQLIGTDVTLTSHFQYQSQLIGTDVTLTSHFQYQSQLIGTDVTLIQLMTYINIEIPVHNRKTIYVIPFYLSLCKNIKNLTHGWRVEIFSLFLYSVKLYLSTCWILRIKYGSFR